MVNDPENNVIGNKRQFSELNLELKNCFTSVTPTEDFNGVSTIFSCFLALDLYSMTPKILEKQFSRWNLEFSKFLYHYHFIIILIWFLMSDSWFWRQFKMYGPCEAVLSTKVTYFDGRILVLLSTNTKYWNKIFFK